MTVEEIILLKRLDGYMNDYMEDKKIEDIKSNDLEKYLQKREDEIGAPDYKLALTQSVKSILDWWAFNTEEERDEYYKKLARQRKRVESEKWKNVYLNPPKKDVKGHSWNPIWDDHKLKKEIDRLVKERNQRRIDRTDSIDKKG